LTSTGPDPVALAADWPARSSEWWAAPDENPGVYVHIPFCRSKCDYCAFATWTDKADLISRYLGALREEIGVRLRGRRASSVFVGGGTPSLLDGDELGELIRQVLVAGHASGAGSDADEPKRREVTVECNPDDASEVLFRAWKSAGVTRVSLGVQSMDPAVLVSLGRRHSPQAVPRAIGWAKEIGFSVNADLIVGAVGQSSSEVTRSVRELVAYGVDHVSAYGLTVEPGTALALDPSRYPDDDDIAAKYERVDRALEESGLCWYEISNWAREGHECQHNVSTWMGGSYVGAGCSAHSFEGGQRAWNVRTPERYLAAIEAGESAVAGADRAADGARERAWLSLRTRRGIGGIGGNGGNGGNGANEVDGETCRWLVQQGLLEPVGVGGTVRWVLSRRGRLLADAVGRALGLP
jgi:oxygen-independent coproporphyrinogen-3 oxidase